MASHRTLQIWRLSVLAQLGLLSACSGQTMEPEPQGEEKKDPGKLLVVTTEDGSQTGRSRYENETTEFRTSAPTCDNAPVDDQAVIQDPNIGGECASGADCTTSEHGYCSLVGGQVYQTTCKYGCEADADCESTSLCDCGPNVGTCVPATCRSDADCGGARCLRIVQQDPCSDGFGPNTFYKCEDPDDDCIGDDDCTAPEVCLSNEDGTRSCRERQLCGIGRPFLVQDENRQADAVRRSDWTLPEALELDALKGDLDEAKLAHLAEGWSRIALMEHASVAAFARFQLQLLALGAPADLIEAANRALVDETRHARIAFGLSSVFSGVAQGPGPLSIEHALSEVDLEEVAELVLLEGCIGETCAALEASWAVGECRDEKLKEFLSEVSDDEKRHSDLAWQFVRFATEQRPGLAERLFARALREAEAHRKSRTPVAASALRSANWQEDWEKAYGLVPEAQRLALRTVAFEEIVLPCLAALQRQAA